MPGRADGSFKLWADKGIRQINDVFSPEDDNIKTFEELVIMYNVPRKHFLKYLQLKSFIGSNQKQSMAIPAYPHWRKL